MKNLSHDLDNKIWFRDFITTLKLKSLKKISMNRLGYKLRLKIALSYLISLELVNKCLSACIQKDKMALSLAMWEWFSLLKEACTVRGSYQDQISTFSHKVLAPNKEEQVSIRLIKNNINSLNQIRMP